MQRGSKAARTMLKYEISSYNVIFAAMIELHILLSLEIKLHFVKGVVTMVILQKKIIGLKVYNPGDWELGGRGVKKLGGSRQKRETWQVCTHVTKNFRQIWIYVE